MWLKVHNTEQDFLMFKYMINIIWYGSFRITSCINPRPISSSELKLSGWYWCLGLIQDVIQKEPYNILYLSCVKIKGKNLQIIEIDIMSTYLISAYQVGNMILSISEVYMIQLSVIKSTVLFWVLQIPPPIKLTATI
jgi:hypothetical protein